MYVVKYLKPFMTNEFGVLLAILNYQKGSAFFTIQDVSNTPILLKYGIMMV